MSSTAVAALRLEIAAAIAAIEPQLRGMQDLARVSLSVEVMGYISRETAVYSQRYALLCKAADALDAIETDGYPDIEKAGLPHDLYAELMQERDDLLAAIGAFEGSAAARVAVDLGQIAEKN